jgi:hypothetical protein
MAGCPPPFDHLVAQGALATPGRPGDADHPRETGTSADLSEEVGDARVAILDHADRACQGACVTGHEAFSKRSVGHRSQSTGGPIGTRTP